MRVWHRQRGNSPGRLAGDPKAFSARRQDTKVRAGLQQSMHKDRARCDKMLAVVEDDEERACPQVLFEDRDGIEAGVLADSQRRRHRLRYQRRSVNGASSTSHTPSRKRSSTSAATCSASRVLPAPRLRRRQERRGIEQSLHVRHLLLAPDEGGELAWEIVRQAIERAKGRKVLDAIR